MGCNLKKASRPTESSKHFKTVVAVSKKSNKDNKGANQELDEFSISIERVLVAQKANGTIKKENCDFDDIMD